MDLGEPNLKSIVLGMVLGLGILYASISIGGCSMAMSASVLQSRDVEAAIERPTPTPTPTPVPADAP